MNGSYILNIRDLACKNRAYLEVVSTNLSQVTIMHLIPGEEIGSEIHAEVDQQIIVMDGKGTSILGGLRTKVETGDMITVHAGTQHNVIADRGVALGVFTVYSGPEHPVNEFKERKD